MLVKASHGVKGRKSGRLTWRDRVDLTESSVLGLAKVAADLAIISQGVPTIGQVVRWADSKNLLLTG